MTFGLNSGFIGSLLRANCDVLRGLEIGLERRGGGGVYPRDIGKSVGFDRQERCFQRIDPKMQNCKKATCEAVLKYL